MDSTFRTATRAQLAAGFDAGLRAHMLRVYNIMGLGVALTGVISWLLASLSRQDGQLTSFGQAFVGSPLIWVFLLAPIGISFFMAARAHKMSAAALGTTFIVYAVSLGIALGPMMMVFTGASIAKVFFIAAATFGAMSLWGYTTGRDLTGMGSFLFMGMVGLLIAGIVNIFLGSSMMDFVISVIGVGLFAGFTAYDTQKIKETYSESFGSESVAKLAVLGAFQLYTDFIGLFVHLLNLIGNRE